MIKVLLALSVLFGVGAAALGFMTKGKVEEIKQDLSRTKTTLKGTEEKLDKTEETLEKTKSDLVTRTGELEKKTTEAVELSAALSREKESVDKLNGQIATKDTEIKTLQEEIEKLRIVSQDPNTPAVNITEVLAQKAELEEKYKGAQAEAALLAEQVKAANDRVAVLQQKEDMRVQKIMTRGLTGKVLAVNPAWNFVVLNMGDRQGVVEGGEMIVRRGDVMVGRIKISKVETSSAIGDIIMSSVPRGMQVQPGDRVVYAGGQ